MTDGLKKMIFASMGIAGLVGLLAIVDIAVHFPFGGRAFMDIMFVLTAGVVGYMGYDALQDMK